ncbi:UNVERIFIED_CONTAM: protein LAZ1 [Sesamum calycinum]|uniref:Protein LAZ1 n=1 Tax=Sesamum calycinum TaxID=2727403 RepID=A0AAW2JCX2_9LAMI
MGCSDRRGFCCHLSHPFSLPALRALIHVQEPEEQKFLIGVILMVPTYAVESKSIKGLNILCDGLVIALINLLDFRGLIYIFDEPGISVGIGILRDCYESFAMYCFGRYLVACLGGEERAIEFMEREGRASAKTPLLDHGSERGIVKHPFPMNYILKPWKLGRWVYQVIKFGIVQYMIIKAFTAISAVILEAFHVYCEGDFKLNCGYPYMAVILNFSQSWALYCLVHFYAITKDELAHMKPLYKFLTFKSIVFLTWWQGVAIALLYAVGLFKSPIAQSLQFKSTVQDFIFVSRKYYKCILQVLLLHECFFFPSFFFSFCVVSAAAENHHLTVSFYLLSSSVTSFFCQPSTTPAARGFMVMEFELKIFLLRNFGKIHLAKAGNGGCVFVVSSGDPLSNSNQFFYESVKLDV